VITAVRLYFIKNQQNATLAVLFISGSGNRPWTSLLDIYHPDTWHAPVAATTVFSTPDNGRRKRPKHVE
jgi:hypothetical protein